MSSLLVGRKNGSSEPSLHFQKVMRNLHAKHSSGKRLSRLVIFSGKAGVPHLLMQDSMK